MATLDGTQDLVRQEMVRRFGRDCAFLGHAREHEVHFRYAGAPEKLLTLRMVQTLMVRKDFRVTRPRTLLSPEHMAALIDLIGAAQDVKGAGQASGFRFDAAGSGSPTMLRIAEQIETRSGLRFDPENGDCVIVLRPGKTGWEVLCRVGNRPLATRAWRTVNYPGSLNAAIAACMVELTGPKPADRYLNVMCGGGTLLIERLLRQGARRAVGIDVSKAAVSASRENARAAGLADRIHLVRSDARTVGFPDAAFDAVTGDLPYGEEHGSRASNAALYVEALREAARLCREGGAMVVLTQDKPSLRAAMPELTEVWKVIDERAIVQREFRPLCMTLRRVGATGRPLAYPRKTRN
ncbi:MAG: methyltransferase domain-containing protein [Candidatus Latescibacterota bacterium]